MNRSAERSDDASSQLSRAISLQLARAQEALEAESDLASAVHEARRAIKRARALLRLAEPWPSTSATDSTLRDASRALAPLRDADVMVLTAKDIRVLPTLLEALEEEKGRRFAESVSADGPLSEAGELLRSVVVDVRTMPAEATAGPKPTGTGHMGSTASGGMESIPSGGMESIPSGGMESIPSGGMELLWIGLGAAYAAVRARSDPAAGEGPVDERSHKLRKRVKDLRYQLEFLDRGQPKLGRLVRDLHYLTDLLGDANDLTTLSRYTASADVLSETERAALTAQLEGRKLALRSEATALSARLFEEDPDSFIRQIEAWVTSPQGLPQG